MGSARQLILVRHGESEWNRDDRFTGWADIGLTFEGAAQMRGAAVALREEGITFELAYSSLLTRCLHSLWVLLDALNRNEVAQRLDWRLNERHYGVLTGQVKSRAEQVYGKEAVWRWRRAFDAQPPSLDGVAQEHIRIDQRYAHVPPERIPSGESLQQTIERVREVREESIAPAMQSRAAVLIVGHGNSLRALIKIIERLADSEIAHLEIANATPIVYALNANLSLIDKRVLQVDRQRGSSVL